MSPRLAIVGGQGTAPMRRDAEPAPAQARVITNCPDCSAELAILRIIGGRGGAEYWTMLCQLRRHPSRYRQGTGAGQLIFLTSPRKRGETNGDRLASAAKSRERSVPRPADSC